MTGDASYRWDPFRAAWVIIAAARESRPYEFPPRPRVSRKDACPFCVRHEADTPPAVAEYSVPGSRFPWDVRVVPNKYPAVGRREGGSAPPFEAALRAADSPFGKAGPACGRHEVVIESPNHVVHWSELDPAHLSLVLRAYRDRLRTAREEGLTYGLVFKNVCPEAGASMEHAHSQFMALDVIPPPAAQREQRMLDFFRRSGRCLLCEWIAWEVDQGARVIHADGAWIAACPYFSRVAGEVWIVPRGHQCHFDRQPDDTELSLATLLLDVVGRCRAGMSCDSHNIIVHTSSLQSEEPAAGHWSIQILPRRVTTAGFEWATDCYINTVPPEQAAIMIRNA